MAPVMQIVIVEFEGVTDNAGQPVHEVHIVSEDCPDPQHHADRVVEECELTDRVAVSQFIDPFDIWFSAADEADGHPSYDDEEEQQDLEAVRKVIGVEMEALKGFFRLASVDMEPGATALESLLTLTYMLGRKSVLAQQGFQEE